MEVYTPWTAALDKNAFPLDKTATLRPYACKIRADYGIRQPKKGRSKSGWQFFGLRAFMSVIAAIA